MPARVFAVIQKSCADSFCQSCLRGLGRGKDVCYNHFMRRRAADIFMDGERKEGKNIRQRSKTMTAKSRPQTMLCLAEQRANQSEQSNSRSDLGR